MTFDEWMSDPKYHICFPYCSGSKYQLREGCHIADVLIRDSVNFDHGIDLAYLLWSISVDVIGFWQECEFPSDFNNIRDVATHELMSKEEFTKYPPTLFLIKEKNMARIQHTQKMVDDFNEKYKIGQEIIRYKLINPKEYPIKIRTRSAAWLMGGHTAVVLADGLAGGVSLDAIEII